MGGQAHAAGVPLTNNNRCSGAESGARDAHCATRDRSQPPPPPRRGRDPAGGHPRAQQPPLGRVSPPPVWGCAFGRPLANGGGRCPPPCGPDTGQWDRGSPGAALARRTERRGRGCSVGGVRGGRPGRSRARGGERLMGTATNGGREEVQGEVARGQWALPVSEFRQGSEQAPSPPTPPTPPDPRPARQSDISEATRFARPQRESRGTSRRQSLDRPRRTC